MITETERLLLRPFTELDTDAMCRVLCDPEVMKFSRGVMAQGDVPGWIKRREQDYSQLGFGLWAVVLKCTNHVTGYCGLTQFPDIAGRSEIEVGYRLSRDSWSHGYGTEAALAARDYGLDVLGFQRLVALIDPANVASIRVAEKMGMRYEKEVMLPGYVHPDRLYVIRRDQLHAARMN